MLQVAFCVVTSWFRLGRTALLGTFSTRFQKTRQWIDYVILSLNGIKTLSSWRICGYSSLVNNGWIRLVFHKCHKWLSKKAGSQYFLRRSTWNCFFSKDFAMGDPDFLFITSLIGKYDINFSATLQTMEWCYSAFCESTTWNVPQGLFPELPKPLPYQGFYGCFLHLRPIDFLAAGRSFNGSRRLPGLENRPLAHFASVVLLVLGRPLCSAKSSMTVRKYHHASLTWQCGPSDR